MMKICKKITDVIAKIAEVICMVMIAALVVVIVSEIVRRKFNSSYRGTIELCGIAFLWMAFMGLIPLYNDNGLMRLDFLSARAKGLPAEIMFYLNKAFSLLLGVVMVVAFVAQYPYVNTRYYSTFSIPVPYTVQYLPMAISGAYIAVKSVEQVVEHILTKTGKTKCEGGAQA